MTGWVRTSAQDGLVPGWTTVGRCTGIIAANSVEDHTETVDVSETVEAVPSFTPVKTVNAKDPSRPSP